MRQLYVSIAMLGGVVGAARAEMGPATWPAAVSPASTAPVVAPSANPGLDRLAVALSDLNLADDQRAQVTALLADVRGQLQGQAGMSPEDRRDTQRQVIADARQKLAAILTPAQQAVLRDAMQARATARQSTPDGVPAPKAEPTSPVAATDSAPMMTDPMSKQATRPTAASTPTRARVPAPVVPPVDADSGEGKGDAPTGATGPTGAVGSRVPDLTLDRLGFGVTKLSATRNRVLVIEFGSYSAPSFRHRSDAMDQLAKEYGGRAEFLLVYTAEAYPAGEWDVDRNKAENISVPRHADTEARKLAAEQMKAALKPTRTVAIDAMSDAAAKAFRAGPHSAFVVGRDGTIVARQQWCDPDGLRRHIEEASAQKMARKETP